MVVLGQDSIMYECRVLYIGRSPPTETLKGIEALQDPLRKKYPDNLDDVDGIDTVIRVLPTALELKYIFTGETVQFPLERLSICAGVRACNVTDGATGHQVRQFFPVNSLEPESAQPAIFAASIRCNKGGQTAECHMFICNSQRDALHLVNATATANMAFKQMKGQRVAATTQNNDVIVVRSEVTNGYADGGNVANDAQVMQSYTPTESKTVRVESGVNQVQPKHYQIQQSNVNAPEPETIYISFDKTNLVAKGDNTMQVTNRTQRSRRTEEYSKPTYVEAPRPKPDLRPMQVPYVEYSTPRFRPVAPPPPRPVMAPVPVFVRPPPPPMMVPVPPPQRLYTKRVVAPHPRFVSQPPVFYRNRARSASPIGRFGSEIRTSKKDAYQPKWQGAAAPRSDVVGHRMSRRDQYAPPPPQSTLEFFQQTGDPRAMHLNERAFSRRMHADNRIMQAHPAYHYPTAYDLHDAMYYDRPTTKSNPRYSSSSSSSSDIGRDTRMRSPRR